MHQYKGGGEAVFCGLGFRHLFSVVLGAVRGFCPLKMGSSMRFAFLQHFAVLLDFLERFAVLVKKRYLWTAVSRNLIHCLQ